MENVLDIYQSPYDEQNPWICFDESCKQLVKETRDPIPAEPGHKTRYDYQYERNGVANMSEHLYIKLLNQKKPNGFWTNWSFTLAPKHGSWLNMAEIELSVVNRQCLNRRLPDQDTLKREIAAWEKERNQKSHSVNWRFTTADARIKLKRLYPSIQT